MNVPSPVTAVTLQNVKSHTCLWGITLSLFTAHRPFAFHLFRYQHHKQLHIYKSFHNLKLRAESNNLITRLYINNFILSYRTFAKTSRDSSLDVNVSLKGENNTFFSGEYEQEEHTRITLPKDKNMKICPAMKYTQCGRIRRIKRADAHARLMYDI